MMQIKYSSAFKGDLKAAKKSGKNLKLLAQVIEDLANGKSLDEKHRDHALKSNWKGYRECHIEPDWLLIYKIYNQQLILTAVRTGSHSKLFNL